MKKLVGKVLALLLCLALAVGLVPASVLAVDKYEAGAFVPGEVLVTLREQYYTVNDEIKGDLAEILPELDIEEYSDMYLSLLMSLPIPAEQWKESLVKMVGTTFVIKLTEKTADAVEASIDALKGNPYVEVAEKNYYAYPDDIFNPHGGWDDEVSVVDALAVLRVAAGIVKADRETVEMFDMDKDGVVTVTDALIVLRIATKLA